MGRLFVYGVKTFLYSITDRFEKNAPCIRRFFRGMTNCDDFGCMSYKLRNDKILHITTVIVLQSLFKTKPHEVTLIDPEAKSCGQAEENALSCTLNKNRFS